jgi:rRNA maturation RNase YbeY
MKKKAKNEIDNITVINLLPYFKFSHIVAKNILLNVFNHFHCKPDNINIIFMGDRDIKRINLKFLSHNYCTDIISFKLSESQATTYTKIEAELYIGIEEVRRNSIFYKTKFYQEIKRVVIHGALHLVGFKDNNKTQKDEMRSWEDHFLFACCKKNIKKQI